jgi:hypothetical protein
MDQSEPEGNVFQTSSTKCNHIYIYIYIYQIYGQKQLIIGLSILNVGKCCIIFYFPSAVVSSWKCSTVIKHLS